MIDRRDIEAVKAQLCDPRDVASRLGLMRGKTAPQGNRGISVLCPAHGEKNNPSLSLTRGPDGTLRVRCHACDLAGDVFDLVAAVEGLSRDRDFLDVLGRAAALAGIHLVDTPQEPRAERPPPPPPEPPKPPRYPPAGELARFLAACLPCRSDTEVTDWLRRRKLDPDLVDLYGLALALPPGTGLPWWARYKGSRESGVAWNVDGYRLIVPMRDATGRVTSVRARAVVPLHESMPKALPPSGFDAVGLVMADHGASLMLASGEWTPGAERQVVICEGEPDWMTAATLWNGDDRFSLAVLGIGGKGQWTQALADRIPDGSTVAVWSDQDDAGDLYAVHVATTLRGRCEVLESYPEARAERRRTYPERQRAKREAERAAREAQQAAQGAA
jgi:DNA primase